MKKYFFLVTLLFCTVISFAQLNYTAAKAQNVAGTYTDLGMAGTAITTGFYGSPMTFDTANSSVQNIGFSFHFNRRVFTQFVLNANGYIKLGDSATRGNIYQVLDSAVVNIIAPFNYDLIAATGPEYRVATSGAEGSRVCTIQFKHLADKTDGVTDQQYDSINFQIKLYETSNIIEFIYGYFDPRTTNMDEVVTATCGIKGSTAASSVNAQKLSTVAWASATFINGNYTGNFFNNKRSILPVQGRTLRFNPVNDAKMDIVYTLSKVPKPTGSYRHYVEAKVTNNGGTGLTNYPVTLNITGANTFTSTKYIDLSPAEWTNVTFDPVSFGTSGANTVTVTVPSDDVNTNNSATYSQVVNDSASSYADNSSPVGAAGFGSDEGMMMTQFLSWGGEILVTGVKVYISNNAANVGKTVYGVAHGGLYAFDIYPISPQPYYYSDPYVIQNADLGTYKTFTINTPGRIFGQYWVGLKQTANATAYYPVGYQAEGPPSRSNTFFKATPPYPTLGAGDEFTDGRLMIEAITKIAPPAIPPYPDVELASWGFEEANSPASVPAFYFHRHLVSSNLLTRGPGAPSSPGNHSFLSTGFGNNGISTSNTDYFQFQIGAGSLDTLSLNSIDLRYLFSDSAFAFPNGFNIQFAYSLNGTTFTLIDTPIHAEFFDFSNGELDYPDKEVDLSDIPALQNITGGTTVTFRMYATGNNTTGAFGFIANSWGRRPLNVRGFVKAGYVIVADPVVPVGADYYLANCSSTATGSIGFTSYGNFAPGNIYTAKLNVSVFDYDTTAVVIGTLASNANSGVINFTIPAGVYNPLSVIWQGGYDFWRDIWIESSTRPEALSIPTQKFIIKIGQYCYSPSGRFRSKQSGQWNNTSTWEMSADGNTWVASTLIPDHRAQQVTIRQTDSVTILTPTNIRDLTLSGKLKILNNGVNNGSITIFHNSPIDDGDHYSIQIDSAAVLYVVSSVASFDSVIKRSSNYWRPNHRLIDVRGKIVVGDGSASNGPGFYKFATSGFNKYIYADQAIFEWNTTSTNGLLSNAEYFSQTWQHYPVLKITNMSPVTFGGAETTVINGTLEVNTPVTMAGAGNKIFRDGLKGTSSLTQAPGSGQFETLNAYTIIPPSADTSGATIGIMDGTLTINLSGAGLRLANGITVTDSANVLITGSGISHGKIEVEPGGKMTMDPGSVLTIEDANLINNGTIDGTGKIQFTGPVTSVLRSPGIINAKIELSSKQLRLEKNATTNSIDLLGGSHLRLDSFHLNMRTGNLVGDASNFIVTNDTGRVMRNVAASEVSFHIGTDETSYTPVTITNTGTPDIFTVRVGQGVFKDSAITHKNVNRTWFIKDQQQGGSNVTLKMQWNAANEQPEFDRTLSYISRLSSCPLPDNCTGSIFDLGEINPATNVGQGNYSLERSAIDSFRTDTFVVTSRPFVFTFTGNGNWSNPLNWTPGIPAPHIITGGMEVIINPEAGGDCISNGNIQVIAPGRLTVLPGKNFKITTQ